MPEFPWLLPSPIRCTSYGAACGQAVRCAPAEDERPDSGTVRLEFSLRPSYCPLRHRWDGSVDAHQRVLATGPGPRARLRPVHGAAHKAAADRVVVDVLDVIHFLPAHARFRAIAHGRSLPRVSPSAVFVLSMAGGGRRVQRTDPTGTQSVPRGTGRGAGMDVTFPSVPRKRTARLHAAEVHSHRFQLAPEARVTPVCRRAVAHFLVSIAEAGAPVRGQLTRVARVCI